ncbi:AN1-like Zinc finger [Oesophagostomum dentatum]|uniref:AN1-like Zinc finger n=1 Tax=Oesophagostomum dentatum TaxID=61180 RepID=A0A0B1STC5_OESDE|nr:AN1-like Zinc finger [Oesophagostomum dentatum]
MEHELTRNKMKRLMRKRKKRKTLLLNPDAALSPEALSSPSANSPLLASTPVRVYEPDPNLTDKCLKLFFEPAESVEEIKMLRSRMTMPPSNMEELMKIQEELASSAKTECQFCHRKLQLAEQEIECLCHAIFCKKHRLPSAHNCSIDYKQTGRSKISRENPKIFEGENHKAR